MWHGWWSGKGINEETHRMLPCTREAMVERDRKEREWRGHCMAAADEGEEDIAVTSTGSWLSPFVL